MKPVEDMIKGKGPKKIFLAEMGKAKKKLVNKAKSFIGRTSIIVEKSRWVKN
jgi:hypothetical protein